MPRVPSEFVPNVSEQAGQMPAVQAPDIAPMQSFAGAQQAEMGNAMRGAGNVVWRVGQIIQDEINEARIKEGDVQLANAANQILRGQHGYLTFEGKAADDQFASAESSLNDAANSILDGLDNDAQRAVFRQVAARNLNSWKGSMADHRNREIRKYNIGTAVAREAMYADLAGSKLASGGMSPSFEADQNNALNERRQALMLQGIPDGSPIMVEQMRDARLNIAKIAVRRLADANDYVTALAYLDRETRALTAKETAEAGVEMRVGRLSEADVGAMRSELLARRKPQMEDELAYSIKNSGTFETQAGTGRYDMPVDSADAEISVTVRTDETKDGRKTVTPYYDVRYSVMQDTPVHAAADAVVDDVGGDMVTLRTSDGTKIFYKNLQNITVKVGDPVSRREFLGTPTPTANGKAEFLYSMERDGISIPANTPNALPISLNRQRSGRPATLSEALDMVKMLPTENQAGVRARLRAAYAEDAERLEASRIDAVIGAKDWVNQKLAPYADLPESSRPVITRQDVRKYFADNGQLAIVNDEDIQRIVDNTGTPGYVVALFESGNMTPALLRRYADVVSREDYRRMETELTKPEYREFKIANDELNEILREMDMSDYVNPEAGSKEEAAVNALRQNVNTMIRRAQEAQGEKYGPDERKKAVKEALRVSVWAERSALWMGMRAPYAIPSMLTQSTEAAERPVRREGESDQSFAARFEEYEAQISAVSPPFTRETVVGGKEVLRTDMFTPQEVNEAIAELAAQGYPLRDETIGPTAMTIRMLSDEGVPKSEMKRLMDETAFLMDPYQRMAYTESVLLMNAKQKQSTGKVVPFTSKAVIDLFMSEASKRKAQK